MRSETLAAPEAQAPIREPVPAGAGSAALVATYAAARAGLAGPDEMLGADGAVRPAYRALVDGLAGIAPTEREARVRKAEQYLREAGVFYRAGRDASERLWPLAFPPLVIEPGEWRALEAGLRQRADYLERLLADLYGERRLVREGILPGRLVGANPEFLRPLADQAAGGRTLLRFIAVDLGRDADGRWRVLADRTQAPSGAGFALENRVATSRAFPDLANTLRVRRLAGFFGRFRETLNALNGTEGARVGLLTPGPLNETYFEHSYLARYLGFHLLEGGDLVVHDDEARIRTVDGLRPVRVLWRRLDADYADPLELFARSRIGTPGLVRAIRAGSLELVNALGSGILETPAFAAFEDAMAMALMGAPLSLGSAQTHWGAPGGNGPTADAPGWRYAPALPLPAGPHAAPSEAAMRAAFARRDLRAVAVRQPALSSVPVFSAEGLVPRPVTLRVFVARGEGGWEVMPGGFARVADSPRADTMAIAGGGRSIDVWIPGEAEEARPVTLLGKPDPQGFQRRLPGSLPARAADNLFWLGRYTERTEAATRIWRAARERSGVGEVPSPVDLARVALLARSGVAMAAPGEAGDPARGLRDLAAIAFGIASRIRDRFSPDGWRVLAEIVEVLDEAIAAPTERDDGAVASRVLTRLAGFSGLVHENMYQFSGWRFLECGRRIERAFATASTAAALLEAGGDGVFEALLDFTDSRMTYRRRFSVELSSETVLDLAILDPLNPRSLAYQVAQLRQVIATLPGNLAGESLDNAARRTARLLVRLQTADPAEVDAAFLTRIAGDACDISDLLTERYFTVGPQGTIERFGAE
ncbi:circularly permuted type 2 ATP-grasp protein [Aureimonas pseudogalii]|uniref:Putative circularly permuted ATP-grasp superfamily protein/putative alpha-E superfamily protein n=1 Tax=Aureimonas pseudogalii TaxID=1744844 RepID=A0A7W6EAK5_9HYPH|nr:circularly permuted type 2 ATP-grasp protein [Aureimonas pseudogalii]MBB3997344.1 putative circularly permuted ATP-grasp superfamily protein/putative alpha-E superfamily protein [Aureimonas pseudogalii]